MDAADAFIGVAAADNEARDLAIDLAIEVGEDGGRQLCAVSVGRAGRGGGGRCACGGLLQLTSMRRLDRLPQVMRALLSGFIVSATRQRLPAMLAVTGSFSLGAELLDDAVQRRRERALLRHRVCFTWSERQKGRAASGLP